MDLISFQHTKRASQGHPPNLFKALDHQNELSGGFPRVALEEVHVKKYRRAVHVKKYRRAVLLYYPGIFSVPSPHVGRSLGIVIPASPRCGHVGQETGSFLSIL